jgi:hypothetical protein
MGDVLKRITQTVRKIVGWINTPGRSCAVMRLFNDTICREIPHVRIGVIEYILFHSKKGFLWFVFSVSHGAKFMKGFFDGPVAVYTFEARVLFAILASSASMSLFSYY